MTGNRKHLSWRLKPWQSAASSTSTSVYILFMSASPRDHLRGISSLQSPEARPLKPRPPCCCTERCLSKMYQYWTCRVSKSHQIQHCTSVGPQKQTCQVWSPSNERFSRSVNNRQTDRESLPYIEVRFAKLGGQKLLHCFLCGALWDNYVRQQHIQKSGLGFSVIVVWVN